MSSACLRESGAILRFIMAGRATFTLVSVQTGARFTFKVQRPRRRQGRADALFVSVLDGPDNEADYAFLGTIFPIEGRDCGTFVFGRRARVAFSAPSARTFGWFWARLMRHLDPAPVAEFWHEGRCGRCARTLTVPASIASGIGPECERKAG